MYNMEVMSEFGEGQMPQERSDQRVYNVELEGRRLAYFVNRLSEVEPDSQPRELRAVILYRRLKPIVEGLTQEEMVKKITVGLSLQDILVMEDSTTHAIVDDASFLRMHYNTSALNDAFSKAVRKNQAENSGKFLRFLNKFRKQNPPSNPRGK